jgi:hypothetical protein
MNTRLQALTRLVLLGVLAGTAADPFLFQRDPVHSLSLHSLVYLAVTACWLMLEHRFQNTGHQT